MTTVTENLDRIQKREAIVAFLAYECEVHPGRNVSDTMINAYEMVLSDYDISALTAAFKKVIETETFFPTPAHVIGAMRKKKEEVIDDNADAAWRLILRIVESVGGYCTPDFQDKAIDEAIANYGGWQALCKSEEKDLVWIRKQFVISYRDAKRRNSLEDHSRSMRGIHGDVGPKKIPCGYLEQPEQPLLGGTASLIRDYKSEDVARFVCKKGSHSWVQLRANKLLGGE